MVSIFGQLFNEYLVDMYSRVEDERLSYLRAGRLQQYNEMRENQRIQNENNIQNT